MIKPEEKTIHLVKEVLDQQAANMPAKASARLMDIRQMALRAHKPQAERSVFWRVSHVLQLGAHPFAYSASVCVITAALAFAWWYQEVDLEEHVDIDTQLLTDELPPHAYLDEQFASWLDSSRNPS